MEARLEGQAGAKLDKRKQDRQSRVPEFIILCLSITIVVAIGTLSYSNARSAESASGELNLARNVVNLNAELLSALKDAESGQHGFLLTGQEQFLEPYSQRLSVIPELFMKLLQLTQPIPDERELVKAIEPLVTAKLSELRETVDLRRSGNSKKALEIVDTAAGKVMMDDIQARSAALGELAERRLGRFTAIADRSSSRLRFAGTAGSALLLAFLIISAATIFRGLSRRDELFSQAFENARRLTVTVSSIAGGVIATDAAARISILNPGCRATHWSAARRQRGPSYF